MFPCFFYACCALMVAHKPRDVSNDLENFSAAVELANRCITLNINVSCMIFNCIKISKKKTQIRLYLFPSSLYFLFPSTPCSSSYTPLIPYSPSPVIYHINEWYTTASYSRRVVIQHKGFGIQCPTPNPLLLARSVRQSTSRSLHRCFPRERTYKTRI